MSKSIRASFVFALSILIIAIAPSIVFAASTEIVSSSVQAPIYADGLAPAVVSSPKIASSSKFFTRGMVTLSFDDGWESQYKNAFPILQQAHLPASFYIITNAMLGAMDTVPNPNILCNDPSSIICDGAAISTTTSSWIAESQYPDPSQDTYTFSQSYSSSAQVTLTISYFNQNGNPIKGQQNIFLHKFAVSSVSIDDATTFTIPASVFSKPNMSFALKETVPAGQTLKVEKASLVEESIFDTYMTTAHVKALQDAGNEIGAHTMDHCDLVMLENDPTSATRGGYSGPPDGACASQLDSPVTPAQEIDGSRSALIANGFSPVDTFVYPYGSYDSNIESMLASSGFIGSRSVINGFNTRLTDPYGLRTRNINKALTQKGDNGLTLVKNWINTAQTNKEWLILMFHNVEPLSLLKSNADIDGTTPEFLQSIVDYLKANNVCVVTMHDGLSAKADPNVDPCE